MSCVCTDDIPREVYFLWCVRVHLCGVCVTVRGCEQGHMHAEDSW